MKTCDNTGHGVTITIADAGKMKVTQESAPGQTGSNNLEKAAFTYVVWPLPYLHSYTLQQWQPGDFHSPISAIGRIFLDIRATMLVELVG